MNQKELNNRLTDKNNVEQKENAMDTMKILTILVFALE
jgi:hypothetical protein